MPWDIAAAEGGWGGIVLRHSWDYTRRIGAAAAVIVLDAATG